MAASLDLSDFEVLGYEVSVPMIASLVASILNTLFITLFNHIYRVVGVRLTDWENHRTDTEYENALIEKNFAFQLVNSYISFFYIAFAKPNRPNLLGVSSDDGEGNQTPLHDMCNGDCMQDLALQMFVVVVSKQFLRNLLSVLVDSYRRLRAHCLGQQPSRPDEVGGAAKLDYEAQLEAPRGMYWEYNEMAIQFGYVTMFAAAAPWASTLCLLNNSFERKADALRMLYAHRRPKYAGASSIGAWAMIFEVLSLMAIVTNVAILAVTSQTLSTVWRMDTNSVLISCVLVEHALLLLKLYVAVRLPDAPLWVLKSRAYAGWLSRTGGEAGQPAHSAHSYRKDAEALQAQYDSEESDLERVWL